MICGLRLFAVRWPAVPGGESTAAAWRPETDLRTYPPAVNIIAHSFFFTGVEEIGV